MEGRQDAGIILVRIVIDVLARGSAHQDFSLVVGGLQKYLLGKVQPRLVGDNLGFEPGGLELAFHVQGGVVVFFAACDMGRGGERLEFFLGQLDAGNGKEILVDFGLPAEVAESQNVVGKRGNLGQDR